MCLQCIGYLLSRFFIKHLYRFCIWQWPTSHIVCVDVCYFILKKITNIDSHIYSRMAQVQFLSLATSIFKVKLLAFSSICDYRVNGDRLKNDLYSPLMGPICPFSWDIYVKPSHIARVTTQVKHISATYSFVNGDQHCYCYQIGTIICSFHWHIYILPRFILKIKDMIIHISTV